MEMASFTGFLETLCYILMFYYIFKFLARIVLPILVKKVVEKAGANFKEQYQNTNTNYTSNASQDEIRYDTSKTTKPREKKKVGEYVDYEELD